MTGTITLWVFGLLCFVAAFAKEAASGAGIKLPGPQTAGARVGVIAVGLLALILGTAIRPKDDAPTAVTPAAAPAPATAVPSTAPAATGATQAAPTPTAPSPTGLTVAWTGQVGIPLEGGVDFDLTPPGRDSGFPKGIYAAGFTATSAVLREEIQMDHDQFGVWTGQAPPSGAACSDWAVTHPGDSAHVGVGSLVCLKSPGGRTALIKIDAIAPSDYRVDATVAVWSG
ncbi:hypothetical protein ACGF12_29660 [Kitasatospora sp. NPDC048296]|uniref:hypothetical protein n=1 Tax=Kitasatospora sp. NPDC048296 TaxID=3364048 RepID=UPI0037166CD9